MGTSDQQHSNESSLVGDIQRNIQDIHKELSDYNEKYRKWQADLMRDIVWVEGEQNDTTKPNARFTTALLAHAEADRLIQLKLRLLNQLGFSDMDDRHERIVEAHRKTFEWIYQDLDINHKSWANFVDWL